MSEAIIICLKNTGSLLALQRNMPEFSIIPKANPETYFIFRDSVHAHSGGKLHRQPQLLLMFNNSLKRDEANGGVCPNTFCC